MPEFTQDWFSHNIPGLQAMMPLLPQRRKFLEIGSFEGRSTLWFAEQMDKDGQIWAIDTWGGSAEHLGIDFTAVKARFDANISNNEKIRAYQGDVLDWMLSFYVTDFDFIYVDGSHTARDTLSDACMTWPLLKKGGIMVFDDYLWQLNDAPTETPKMAVDAFIACYRPKLEVVLAGYQVGVRKL